jgi:hypothetical protein
MALKKIMLFVRTVGKTVCKIVGAVIENFKGILIVTFSVSAVGACVTGILAATGVICPASLFPAFFLVAGISGVWGDTLLREGDRKSQIGEETPLLLTGARAGLGGNIELSSIGLPHD